MDVIAYTDENGDLSIVVPYYAGGFTVESEMRVVPEGAENKIVSSASLPSRLLRNAFKLDGDSVKVDLVKGKTVSHEMRRAKREEALKDNTAILTKNGAGIPLSPNENAATAASENAAYMLTDDVAQVAIDNSTNEADLLAALSTIGI